MFKRPLASALISLVLSGLSPFVLTAESGQTAHAVTSRAFCRNSNQVTNGTKLGSQVDGDVLTICLSREQLKLLKPKQIPVKARPLPAARPVVTAKTRPKPKPMVVSRPSIQPAPGRRGSAKPVSSRTQARRRSNDGTFRPAVSPLLVSPLETYVGNSVSFSSMQLPHLGRTTLLGRRVEVRFTPLTQLLHYGDGASVASKSGLANSSHSYLAEGDYQATLEVTFGIEYRVAGGSWFRDPELISIPTAPVVIHVHQNGHVPTKPKVVLVTPNG